jgi:hypothetical protein
MRQDSQALEKYQAKANNQQKTKTFTDAGQRFSSFLTKAIFMLIQL